MGVWGCIGGLWRSDLQVAMRDAGHGEADALRRGRRGPCAGRDSLATRRAMPFGGQSDPCAPLSSRLSAQKSLCCLPLFLTLLRCFGMG